MSVSRLVFPSLAMLSAVVAISFFAGKASAAKDVAGEPVYLKEKRSPPPVKEVRHQTIEKKYEDKKTIRVKFKVVQFSDDSFVNDGPFVEYYKTGQKYQEGKFKYGIYSGEWTYWHPNGQVCRKINFTDGKPDGQWEVFREDGTRQEIQSFEKGVRSGVWKSFYPDGETTLIEVTYQEGGDAIQRVSYHKNGNKRQEMNLKNGRMHGTTTEWDESGKKTVEVEFDNGKRGEMTRF